MISAERLGRYKDFVDPERTGTPYDPRQGLERLMGILSPDPKGIVLAAMREDWYGSESQLRSGVFAWLKGLGLSPDIWPIKAQATWSYCEHANKRGEIVDGSLIDLGAVVKKAEDPSQVLYSRSIAGAELVVPLVQQAIMFVSKAREYAEARRLQGKESHKYDSMWRVIGSVSSQTDQRRPRAIWEVVDFLTHNPGSNRQLDLELELFISQGRLRQILSFLGNTGIIDYVSPATEKEGQKGKGWAIFTLSKAQSADDLNSDKVYWDIKSAKSDFRKRILLGQIIGYIKKHPDEEYEYRTLAKKLNINPTDTCTVLSWLTDSNILERPEYRFEGGEVESSASANYLTYLFYDLVCVPAGNIADTLSPLSLRSWQREELAVFLKNYGEERSNIGPQAGYYVRGLILEILHGVEEMKLSQVVDLYNSRAERELKDGSVGSQMRNLLRLGLVEQSRLGYYRLV